MRGYIERPNLISGAAVGNAGTTQFSKEFPMGEGWYAMYLVFNLAFTVGTGTTPITEGELLYIKNVLLRTDRGEILCNLPGRALWKIAALKTGALPYKDAIAAATATYRVFLPIYFCDPESGPMNMARAEDTILNTGRYNSVSLQITAGSVSDLLTTVGTSSVTTTLDVEVMRSFGALPGDPKIPGSGGLPVGVINYDYRPPVDAASLQFIDMERSPDLSLKRVYVHSGTSGTAGVPWSGTNADTIISVVNIRDQSRFIEKDRIWRQVTYANKSEFGLESVLSGVGCFNFVADGSILSALATADKSELKAQWTNGTAPANSIVTLTQEGVRALK